jgi:hypothetical protein
LTIDSRTGSGAADLTIAAGLGTVHITLRDGDLRKNFNAGMYAADNTLDQTQAVYPLLA